METVLVTKDVNYAASKTSATQETAARPDQLADGAIGVYGMHKHSTNGRRLSLITLATTGESNNIYKVADSDFAEDELYFAVGTAEGCIMSPAVAVEGIKSLIGAPYSAIVNPKFAIGYNSVDAGDLNTPDTIVKYDEITIRTFNFLDGGPNTPNEEYYTLSLAGGETDYQVAVKLIDRIVELVETYGNQQLLAGAGHLKVISNGTGTPATTSATLAAVYGATSMTASAAHGIGVGDWVIIEGDLYQAVTGTTGSTLVVDRPYKGVTKTVANADFIDATATVPTKIGVEVTGKDPDSLEGVSADGIIAGADVRRTTAGSWGVGVGSEMLKREVKAKKDLGSNDAVTSYMPFPTSLVDKTKNYDLYTLIYSNPIQSKGDAQRLHRIENIIAFLYPNDGSAAPSNGVQSTFEIVMETIYPKTVGIIA